MNVYNFIKFRISDLIYKTIRQICMKKQNKNFYFLTCINQFWKFKLQNFNILFLRFFSTYFKLLLILKTKLTQSYKFLF